MVVTMLTEPEEERLETVAETAAVHTEQFCENCRQEEVDPLGIITGINTPANKTVNSIVDEVLEREGLDPVCRSEIRMEVVEEFQELFNRKVENKMVDSHIKCFYCFENKKFTGDHIPIFVSEDPTGWFDQERKWL
jgi:hypothetical protein